jgi:hypothetical protein
MYIQRALLQRAIQKLNLCDTAINSMLLDISQAVQKVCGRADWLILDNPVVPRMLCTTTDHEPHILEHFVYVITLIIGEQHIADLIIA